MNKLVTMVTEPVVSVIAGMELYDKGLLEMAEWVRSRAPQCLPDGFDSSPRGDHDEYMHERVSLLWPHHRYPNGGELTSGEMAQLTDNELLVELAGRKCYNSFGLKAGKKSNREYIANTQAGPVPHASIMYHAKMSFFIAGVSRRVSHELIRHYVGADRTEDGSPSQESTRYCEHPGFYVPHPFFMNDANERQEFESAAQLNYNDYLSYVKRAREIVDSKDTMGRKRVLESASAFLMHSVETSFIWTTNPIALAKMFKERDNVSADLEYQRFAKKWKSVCLNQWPNLF